VISLAVIVDKGLNVRLIKPIFINQQGDAGNAIPEGAKLCFSPQEKCLDFCQRLF
jgi:hypothetical protein